MRTKLLFVHNNQFGALIDSLKWCQYLDKTKYDIYYICFNDGRPKTHVPGVHVTYIPRLGPKLIRGLIFYIVVISRIIFFKGFIDIIYFPGSVWLKRLLPFKKMHLDIRTLSVHSNKIVRIQQNKKLNQAICLFNSITAISRGVIDQLDLNEVKIKLLPLGADTISTTNKSFKELKLLYVGTLYNRNIEQTVLGLKKFIDSSAIVNITYDIVGGDNGGGEFNKLKNVIKENHLENIVRLHGRLSHNELTPFFNNCNIGVCYVPIVEYFNDQPSTKLFEYVFSGMVCLATKTRANVEVANEINSVMISDNSDSFCEGLVYVLKNSGKYNSSEIRNSLQEYSWSNIVNKYLEPIINQ
ncbi:glycosyltransferase [Segatella bryantii]|uniref:glycosyltransferase n=1 Tax=Segatella bryantii TaxID=77095 RepID=UPI00241CBB24|nr:glycosyltransferase [Segatella bryantii]